MTLTFFHPPILYHSFLPSTYSRFTLSLLLHFSSLPLTLRLLSLDTYVFSTSHTIPFFPAFHLLQVYSSLHTCIFFTSHTVLFFPAFPYSRFTLSLLLHFSCLPLTLGLLSPDTCVFSSSCTVPFFPALPLLKIYSSLHTCIFFTSSSTYSWFTLSLHLHFSCLPLTLGLLSPDTYIFPAFHLL